MKYIKKYEAHSEEESNWDKLDDALLYLVETDVISVIRKDAVTNLIINESNCDYIKYHICLFPQGEYQYFSNRPDAGANRAEIGEKRFKAFTDFMNLHITERQKFLLDHVSKFEKAIDSVKDDYAFVMDDLIKYKKGILEHAATITFTLLAIKKGPDWIDSDEMCKVVITNSGGELLRVVKVIKDMFGYGLKECKDIVDATRGGVGTGVVAESVPMNFAQIVKKMLEQCGA